MWSPLQKYTVQQFRRGMLLQLINIVLCTLSLIFNNTYFLVAGVYLQHVVAATLAQILRPSFPAAELSLSHVCHRVSQRLPGHPRCSWAERLLSHLFCDHASAVSI